MLTGTAITIPINEVSSVPKIAGKAPKISVTGFQILPAKNPAPKAFIDGAASILRITTMAIKITTIKIAKNIVRLEKILSPRPVRCLSFLFMLKDGLCKLNYYS